MSPRSKRSSAYHSLEPGPTLVDMVTTGSWGRRHHINKGWAWFEASRLPFGKVKSKSATSVRKVQSGRVISGPINSDAIIPSNSEMQVRPNNSSLSNSSEHLSAQDPGGSAPAPAITLRPAESSSGIVSSTANFIVDQSHGTAQRLGHRSEGLPARPHVPLCRCGVRHDRRCGGAEDCSQIVRHDGPCGRILAVSNLRAA